ncbi:short-chain fatty acyl-CoA regulator family protein [Myxococcus sp. K15C18031901]|uniref:short-chain fatty acyl-CoA regulator family protein n=1 Tax=Myxococcus dinghuensis TaxID=2906761 RepID=UPI0020A7AD57|nr:short-chain fatty acyl-CoA regulator family protein [Myxococcus dinghuensis]MCP3099427.1 short-chain fatty acyl-CoA regulator family protein [Myxococcus dinghuensis]
MSKSFMGMRLRRLREERGLSQSAAARALGLSASYYNQIENDERPLTVAVLVKVSAVFGVDVQVFSEEEEARLISDMREALTASVSGESISVAELRGIATGMPAVGRALVAMHRQLREALERVDVLVDRLGGSARDLSTPLPLMPFEEVRDFFYSRHNYIDELDTAAERLFKEARLQVGDTASGLAARLERKHGVKVLTTSGVDAEVPQRKYVPSQRTLMLESHLTSGQQAFQMATQLAFLEFGTLLQKIVDETSFSSDETRALARIGLANYFAGALVMPYQEFLRAAEALRYDIDLLRHRFGVGFEVTCHRLSTLQRGDARGVPFFFVRVDRAGNISKRQSATDFHFSRVGGTCPLWNVYEAFAQPGRVLRQLAQMPDGRTYLWIARTVSRGHGGYGSPTKTFAIALGCDVSHAGRLVYSKGLALDDPSAPTPIGAGCKVCEREACPQRAFPPMGARIIVDENERRLEPYSAS